MNEVVIIFAILTFFAIAILGLIAFIKMQPIDLRKVKDLAEVLPIQSIENNLIINGNGDLSAGFKIFLPEVFTLSENDAKELHKDFVGLLKLLPEGTIVHKQDFFFLDTYKADHDIDNLIHKENLEYYNGRPTICNYSNIYVTFTAKQWFSKSHTISLQLSPNYPFKQQFKGLTSEKMEMIRNLLESFENKLKSLKGFKSLRMENEELRDSLFDYLNMSWEKPSTNSNEKVINPISIDEFDGSLRIGNKYIAVLSLKDEGAILEPFIAPKTSPGSVYGNGIQYSNEIKAKASMVFPLACGLPIDHVINTVIEITNNDKMLSHLNSKKKELNFIANFYVPAKTKQGVIQLFIDTINQGAYQTCFTSVNVVLTDVNKQSLQRKIGLTEGAFMNMNHATCMVENIDTANCLFATLPGNANSIFRNFINTTDQAVCYINKESLYLSDPYGFLFIDRFGNPVIINMWDSPLTINRNKLIFGPSGSGKSYLINGLLNQSLYAGNHVIMIDIGHSYKKNCELNKGKYFNSAEKKSLSFNIFICDRDKNGNYIYIDTQDNEASDDKVTFIYTILSTIWKGQDRIEQVEKALLKKSIQEFYEYVNKNKIFPNMAEYYKFLDIYNTSLDGDEREIFKVKHIKIMLEPFVMGQYKHLLNADSNINIVDDKFIVFDLEELQNNKDIFTLVAIIIIELVCQKIKILKGINKTLIIDEALNFLEDEKMGDFIGYLFRTIRKKEGEVYIAAQNVRFLQTATEKVRDSIIINTATQILLDHSEHRSTYPAIQGLLSFTDHEIELLDSIENGDGYKEFFIRMGKKAFIMRMDVSDFSDAVFTSKEVEITKISKLFTKHRNLRTAIYQYLEDKKSNIQKTKNS